jgi:hypothetical protein
VSDDSGTQETSAGSTGPRPEPIRFFGTTWLNHDNGYTARRIAVAAGSLTAAVASASPTRASRSPRSAASSRSSWS